MNRARADEGLTVLTPDYTLIAAAQRHSEDMAKNRFMEHEASDGSTMVSRVTEAGYDWASVSENLAAGQPNADSVVAAWLRSPMHRANILDGSLKHVGIGYAVADDEYRHYWTADFGSTKGPGDVPLGGCHP